LDTVAAVDADYEKEALGAIAAAQTLEELEQLRTKYLGRNSQLKLALREVRDRDTGMELNRIRTVLEDVLADQWGKLEQAELDRKLSTERVDVTLPARMLGELAPRPRGTLHPSTQVRRGVEDIFLGLGYEIVDGREVETTRYNFDALGFPDWHPTRSPRASLYLDDEIGRAHV